MGIAKGGIEGQHVIVAVVYYTHGQVLIAAAGILRGWAIGGDAKKRYYEFPSRGISCPSNRKSRPAEKARCGIMGYLFLCLPYLLLCEYVNDFVMYTLLLICNMTHTYG